MNISFENVFREPIHENQTSQLDIYYKVYNLNGRVKQKEQFYDGELCLLKYYKDINETNQKIMDDLFVPGKFISIIESEIRGAGYLLEREFGYDTNGNLSTKANKLYDLDGNLIAHEWISDLVTGIPEYDITKKYFYDRNVNPNRELFECRYSEEDGKLIEIYYNNLHLSSDEQESIVFHDSPEDILELRRLTGISQQLAEYYVSPDVIPVF